jgi:hypothetical protein
VLLELVVERLLDLFVMNPVVCCREQLKHALQRAGVATAAFDEFVANGGRGDAEMRRVQEEAESSGIAGGHEVSIYIALYSSWG